VETAEQLRVWCSGGQAAVHGDPVTVAVRPEKIEIDAAAPAAMLNVVSGRVIAGVFLGEQTEYRVRLEHGADVVVRRQNLGSNGTNSQIAPGAQVYLSWRPDVSLVLPRTDRKPEEGGNNK
jgi:ABC-type Fe3+/spermidine/putrescine transport system ATPase subunit